ncbi:MAG: AAA family ATPase [Candidatus Aegiribacteria sp.]|nr:AAA family ATPase [Candidatus Aegiribacteria sp.]MBD3294372.1 AAA family ATPase [Candidatus Fermentibacteria bacterium]
MLCSLKLKNLATISDTSVEFDDGLNILTGETGAGKSILIDGLLLALGNRADRTMVRPGARTASVEALFSVDDGDEYLVRREVRARGRSRFFVNDELRTLDEGRELISGLVDLHSQDSTPALLKGGFQREALDEYGTTSELARELQQDYILYEELTGKMESLKDRIESSSDRIDIARHELSLIEKLDPTAEDYQSLSSERKELKSAEESAEKLSSIVESISGDDGMLRSLRTFMKSLTASNAGMEEVLELIDQAEISLSEASAQCEKKLSMIENAPWRLDEIDKRLDAYSELLGRCGGSLESLLGRRGRLEDELRSYSEMEEELQRISRELPELADRITDMAQKLSSAREQAAKKLEAAVQDELRLLGMPRAVFRVAMEEPGEGRSRVIGGTRVSRSGCEIPRFMFSANPGMEPGYLSSIASGGEMSRISLVLKLALSNVTQAPTMIFDEIDSGVGGKTAHLLGDSLSRVSNGRQVIVITHLPQIACRARRHLAVSKKTEGGLPVTSVRALFSEEDRVEELARLLGGGSGAREHALKMFSKDEDGAETDTDS